MTDKNFYVVSFAAVKQNEIRIKALSQYDEQSLIRGDGKPLEPFKLRIDEGSKLYDIAGYQDVYNFAVSERVVDVFRKNKISGWDAYDVSIVDVPDKYYGFQVLGRCSKVKRHKKPGYYKGYKFDLNTWDGSDFFIPDGTLTIVCTEKVKQLMSDHKVSNVSFENTLDREWYDVGEK